MHSIRQLAIRPTLHAWGSLFSRKAGIKIYREAVAEHPIHFLLLARLQASLLQ